MELDLRGLKCPLPVLRARKALDKLMPGDELTMLATDPMAAIDLPHMCHEDGHRLISADRIDARTLRFVILCGSQSAEPAREA